MSDSDGFIYDPDGINDEKLAFRETEKPKRGRIGEYAANFKSEYFLTNVWKILCIALPCYRIDQW